MQNAPVDLDRLDERQARIYRGPTDFISPGTADWFADACRLMNLGDTENSPFRFATQAHLMAHLLREVESALGRVLRSIPGAPEALDEGRQLALEGAIREARGASSSRRGNRGA
jgi:hypothetical protein